MSAQNHYDFGLRAMSTVIIAAGLMVNKGINEDEILVRALRSMNIPKLLKDDITIFENLIKDFFPNAASTLSDDNFDLINAIKTSCE